MRNHLCYTYHSYMKLKFFMSLKKKNNIGTFSYKKKERRGYQHHGGVLQANGECSRREGIRAGREGKKQRQRGVQRALGVSLFADQKGGWLMLINQEDKHFRVEYGEF